MELIKELIEARMHRRLGSFRGQDVGDIAKNMFNHFIMLRSLYDLDKNKAVKYAKEIVQRLNFDGYRASMPDLYNMIVMVKEQHKYADQLFNNWKIVLPEMRIKRVIRDIASGELNARDFAQLMIMLQRKINLDGDQMRMRRLVSTENPAQSELNWMQKRLITMTRRNINSDLHEIYRKAISK